MKAPRVLLQLPVTLIGGQMLALLVLVLLQNTLGKDVLTEWGWRIPFAIGGVAALVVLWLRRSMEETVSEEQVRAAKAPLTGEARPGTMKLLFTQHWKPLLICIGVTLSGTVAFYTYTNFILKFMNDTSGIAKTDTSVINFWALLIFMLLQPVHGMISDKVGRKPLLLWSTHLDREQGDAWSKAPAALDDVEEAGRRDDDMELTDTSRR